MTRAEEVYQAFCEYASKRLETAKATGEPVDPKEVEQFVKFLKDQAITEGPEIVGSTVSPSVLALSKQNLAKQVAER
jgi:hypothetical protein